MLPASSDAGAAPRPGLVDCGALRVDHPLVPERELAGAARGGGAGRDAEGLGGAGGGGGDLTVSPAVGHHAAVSVGLSGAPGHWAVSVGALVVGHSLVTEWEDAAAACSTTLPSAVCSLLLPDWVEQELGIRELRLLNRGSCRLNISAELARLTSSEERRAVIIFIFS